MSQLQTFQFVMNCSLLLLLCCKLLSAVAVRAEESAVLKKKFDKCIGHHESCALITDLSLSECLRKKARFMQSSRMHERERKTTKIRTCMNSMVRN